MSAQAPLLQAARLWKHFGGVTALRDVSFELRPGEVHALVGENGAGKSTLIKILTGAVRPDTGTLEIRGQRVPGNDPARARALGVAAIYQQPALFPELTVAENIALGRERGGWWRVVDWSRRRAEARQLLRRVGAAIDPALPVRRLSMPEQQLVEIARALGTEARVLIMDEPTASLSDREVERLFQVIDDLRAHGVGILYVSHRLEELGRVADRVTVLRDGAKVATRPLTGLDRGELIRLMVGREVATVFPKRAVPIGSNVLDVRHLTCHRAGLRDVSLTVRAGEIVGLAGLVGAGRTELAKVLFGLRRPDSGTIRYRGALFRAGGPHAALRQGIALLPEDRRRQGVIEDLSVARNNSLTVLARLARVGVLRSRAETSLAESFVRRLGIKTPSVKAPVAGLSGGNQQKVALAGRLAVEPALVILDEPTQGVDVGAKAEIHRLMGDLAERGLGVLMISSELTEILGMSDRIVVMHEGRVTGVLDRSAASQETVLALALGHTASETGTAP